MLLPPPLQPAGLTLVVEASYEARTARSIALTFRWGVGRPWPAAHTPLVSSWPPAWPTRAVPPLTPPPAAHAALLLCVSVYLLARREAGFRDVVIGPSLQNLLASPILPRGWWNLELLQGIKQAS